MTAGADYEKLRRRCAEALDESGQFGALWVREAFEAVAREAFVPSRVRISGRGDDSGQPLIDRDTDPDAWAQAVYVHDRALITQLDDGTTALEAGAAGRFSSSLSSLRVVVRQLSHLDLEPGHKVLHIGTGSGYDSALLAERADPADIVTVEVDPTVAAMARRNLDAAGYGRIRTVVHDGEQGWPDRAPYDRVLATASANRIPWLWVAQTAPGGVIVTPYRGLALLRLVVADDGQSACGPVVDEMAFMVLRGQRDEELTDIGPIVRATRGEGARVRTEADLSALDGELGAEFLFHILVPGAVIRFGEAMWWFQTRDGSSWAGLKKDGRGRQWGPRRLLDEAESAVTAWTEAGAPRLTELGVTVRPEGDRVWAGSADGPSWPVPTR